MKSCHSDPFSSEHLLCCCFMPFDGFGTKLFEKLGGLALFPEFWMFAKENTSRGTEDI